MIGGNNMRPAIMALLVLATLNVAYAATTSASFSIDVLRYEPVPANPGDTVNVWLQITNTGDTSAQGVTLTILESYPFIAVGSSASGITVGTLAARNEYVTKVPMLIDRNAPAGTFELHIRLDSGAAGAQEFTIPLEVEVSTASLAVSSVETLPSELLPGKEASLLLIVQNIDEALLSDLTVTLGLDGSVFAPLGGTNQQKVARLSGGQAYTFRFRIVPQPDAPSNVYRIPVQFNYTLSDGTTQGQQQSIGLVVRAEPELFVVVDDTALYSDGRSGTVLLRLVNKGLSEIKFAQATLLEGEGYTNRGSSSIVYVGNIDSDDFETAEYTLEADEEEFDLQVRVEYKDALNNAYDVTVPVHVQLQEPPKQGTPAWLWVVLLLVAVAGVVWWRRRRKKR